MAGRIISSLRCGNVTISFKHGIHLQREFSSAVFVSRLSSYTTEERLRQMFLPFGTIKEVRLIRDKFTRRPKGFGFVEYQNEAEAKRALEAMNYKIVDGRLIFVEMAKKDVNEDSS